MINSLYTVIKRASESNNGHRGRLVKDVRLVLTSEIQQKKDQEWTNGGASQLSETNEWSKPGIRKQKSWKLW